MVVVGGACNSDGSASGPGEKLVAALVLVLNDEATSMNMWCSKAQAFMPGLGVHELRKTQTT